MQPIRTRDEDDSSESQSVGIQARVLTGSERRHISHRRNGKPLMRMLTAATIAVIAFAPFGQVRADPLTGTFKQINERKTIAIGVGESSIPFSYLDSESKSVGYAIDLCNIIAGAIKKRLQDENIETKLIAVAPATRIALLSNGTLDMHCSANTNNLDRQKVLGFSDTIFLTSTRFVSKKAKNINTIEDLRGRTVASTAGTNNLKQLVEINAKQQLGMTVLTSKDHAEGFLLVESGRADAFVMDDIMLAGYVAGAKDPSAYVISTEALAKPEPYGIMIRKDDPAFKTLVDDTLASIFKGPQIIALYDKWFMRSIPPRGINLNFPISVSLKRAFAHPTDSPDPDAY